MSNGNTNRTAVGFAGAQPQRPKTGDHLRATPNSYDQTATQSIQQNNLSYQQQQLQIQQQQQQQQAQAAAQQRLAQEREQQRLQRQKQNLEAFQQQMANQGRVRFQQNSTAPLQDTKKSVLIDSPLDRQNDRAFDSDDGAARARRESRLRRMKLLEQRRNVLCGETTDDNEERNEQVQRERTKRSKKYTRSKTDGNAAEMRAAMLSKNNKLDRNGKPKVLEQFERKLLKNENRAPSSERNGVIERRLSGSSHGAAALADGKTPIDQLNSMVSNFKMADQPKPSTTPPSVKVDEQPQASVESLKNQIQQRNNSTAADASPRQTAQTRGRLNAQSYRQFTALGNNATSGTSTNNNIGSTIGQDMGGVPSNLSRGKGLSGSTPNLSESQMNEKYQRGFDTTPAERAAQLRKAREQIEQEKIKRTESLKQRISMFEAARQRSNQTDSPPQATPNNVTRSQSLKMAPTFLNQSKTISATEEADRNQVLDQQRKQNNAVISENFAKNRSMVAGILNAGPPKKKASKYGRALTQPIEAADRTEPIVPVNVPERPSGPANRRLPSRWRSGERKSTTSGYDLDLSVD